MYDDCNPLFVMPKLTLSTKWASPENPSAAAGAGGKSNGGRKGAPNVPLKAGASILLAEEAAGSGTIRRIWMTMENRSPAMLRGLRLDCCWDGAEKPAVSVPLGDFFGIGLGRTAAFECALFSSPEGRSFHCTVPMPFKAGMKITLTNESGFDLDSLFYDINYTVGDGHGDDTMYFHAYFNRENPTCLQHDYAFLPRVCGRGHFLGLNAGVIVDRERYFHSWWGEGECKIFLDGDERFPSLCGTGTEDYIGTGWGQGQYAQWSQGCPIADTERMHYCFYRYHLADPVYFHRDIRVSMQQIGGWSPEVKPLLHNAGRTVYKAGQGLQAIDFSERGGAPNWGLFERQDDWSSCAYFYLDRPDNELPGLLDAEARMAGLPDMPDAVTRMDG